MQTARRGCRRAGPVREATRLMKRKLEPEFKARLLRNPDVPVRLIVGVEGGLATRSAALSERGLTVHCRLRLLNALATGATGRQALALCKEPWVSWIEEDREMRVAH